ncbi:MAG TPA: NADH-quinone oxidoreductase subunit A [Thermoanaerobaculia bacterium]|nr:NADH-quinone oxidoreductase subunit A [Thermoanaerobaculia bacterium]
MFLFGEMIVFIALLAVGYVYVWKKKTFDWD